MTELLRSYLLSIVAAALLCSIVLTLIPEGVVKRIGSIACGLVMILVCIVPIHSLDTTEISQAISRILMQQVQNEAGVEVHSLELTQQLIKQKAEAYILDKAETMGLALEADVHVTIDAEYPFPDSVTIRGKWNAQQREVLTDYIENNLAIEKSSQEWISE